MTTNFFSFQSSGRELTEYHEIEFSATESTVLIIKNIDGNIYVDDWEYDFISLDYVLTTEESYGKEEFDKVEIQSTENQNILTIETVYVEDPVHVDVEFTLQIPSFVTIKQVETVNGNLHIYDFKQENGLNSSLFTKTTNGKISLHDITVDKGDLSVISETGDLSLYDVCVPSGCLQIDTDKGDVTLQQVSFGKGCLTINTSEGDLYLNDLTVPMDDLTIFTGSGDIDLYDVSIPYGTIDLTTKNGKIYVNNLNINTSTGLTVRNDYGDISINDLTVPKGDVSFLCKDNKIHLYNLNVPRGNLKLLTKTGDIHCNNVNVDKGNVNLFSESGDLSVYDLLIPTGSFQADTITGDVTLHDLSFAFDDLTIQTTGKGRIYLNDVDVLRGNVSLSTDSGDVSVYDLSLPQGRITLETFEGEISIHNATFPIGNLQVDTENKGKIYLNDVTVLDGDMLLQSEEGRISVYDSKIPTGKLYVETDTGKISVMETEFSTYDFTTNTGDVSLHDLIIPSDSLSVTTTGDISVYDVRVVDGGIYLDTIDGDITAIDISFTNWAFNTSTGDIYVGGFSLSNMDLILSTEGDISVSDVVLDQGDLCVNTPTGNIFVGSVDVNNRPLNLSTTGSIAVRNSKAMVSASSVKGDIFIKNTTGFTRLFTEKGTIEADLISVMDDVEITTRKGNVILIIDPGLDAILSLDVYSLIGGIFLTTMRPLIDIQSATLKHVEGTIGSGGNEVSVSIGDETVPSTIFGGFITLKKMRTPLFPLSFFMLTNAFF